MIIPHSPPLHCSVSCTPEESYRVISSSFTVYHPLLLTHNMEAPIEKTTKDITEERTPSQRLDSSAKILNFEQVEKLLRILKRSMMIHSHNNFPNLTVKLVDLIHAVKRKLKDARIELEDVRLNGSAASYVLCSEPEHRPPIVYKDLDLIFHVEIDSEEALHAIKESVLSTLIDFMPRETAKDRIITSHLEVAYVKKMAKIFTEKGDRWSLISLNNHEGRNIDLKFVSRMRRQYEFTADSFHVVLDSPMVFMDTSNAVTEDFFPNVEVLSVGGDFEEALSHLNNRLIATTNPEEIRGGGLLKYCYMRTCGYQLAHQEGEDQLHQLMCVRFFIDFPTEELQLMKYTKYLATHFNRPDHCVHFLNVLLAVVSQSRCIRPYDHLQAQQIICNLIGHHVAMYRPQSFLFFPTGQDSASDSTQPQLVLQRVQHPPQRSQPMHHHSYQGPGRGFNRNGSFSKQPVQQRVNYSSGHFGQRRYDTPPGSPFPNQFEKNLPPRMQRQTVDPVQ